MTPPKCLSYRYIPPEAYGEEYFLLLIDSFLAPLLSWFQIFLGKCTGRFKLFVSPCGWCR